MAVAVESKPISFELEEEYDQRSSSYISSHTQSMYFSGQPTINARFFFVSINLHLYPLIRDLSSLIQGFLKPFMGVVGNPSFSMAFPGFRGNKTWTQCSGFCGGASGHGALRRSKYAPMGSVFNPWVLSLNSDWAIFDSYVRNCQRVSFSWLI